MNGKNDILKLLGFSDEYLEALENYKNNNFEVIPEIKYFESFKFQPIDSSNLTISESFNNFSTSYHFKIK
jgi:hypothetical protein